MINEKFDTDVPRLCRKCKKTKKTGDFYRMFRLRDQYWVFSSYCKQCESERRRALRQNPVTRKDQLAARRAKNLTEDAKKARAEYLKRPEVHARNRKLARAQYHKKKKNPAYVICQRISVVIRRSIKSGKNNRSWRDFVDYSIEDLRAHLERQFTRGMTWKNIGEWHIDHIVPLSSFQFDDPRSPEFKRAWALSNLRPLWASENIKKKNARVFLL